MRTIQSELKRHGLKRSSGRARRVREFGCKPSKKVKEMMSDRDWAEIMGTNRPTYSRKKGGAYRQR